MAKIKSHVKDGKIKWDKEDKKKDGVNKNSTNTNTNTNNIDNVDPNRTFYDIRASDKRGHSMLLSIRWTDEDSGMLQSIVDSKKSPEFRNTSDAARGLLRDAMKRWMMEQDFAESSLQYAIKQMFLGFDEDYQRGLMKKILADRIESFAKRKTIHEVKSTLKKIINDLPDELQHEIHEVIGNSDGGNKYNTKEDIANIIKSLREDKAIENMENMWEIEHDSH